MVIVTMYHYESNEQYYKSHITHVDNYVAVHVLVYIVPCVNKCKMFKMHAGEAVKSGTKQRNNGTSKNVNGF